MMDSIKPFLDFLKEIQADYITVGDAGVFYVLKRDGYPFKTIYDASTMVTSSRQINFWGKQAGASEAVLAREIPSAELFVMAEKSWSMVLALSTIRNDLFFRIITTLSRQKNL